MVSARATAATTLAVLFGLVHVTRASGQDSTMTPRYGTQLAAEVAALRYVKAEFLNGSHPRVGPLGTMILDVRVGSDTNYFANGQPKRSVAVAHELAAALGGKVADGDSVLVCGTGFQACRIPASGTTLIRLGHTIVRNDSAHTTITLLRATGESREPVSHVTWHILLHASGNGVWQVVPTATRLRQT